MHFKEFPGDPGVRTQHFHCHDQGSIPGQKTKTLQTVQCGQKIRKKKYITNVKKELHFYMIKLMGWKQKGRKRYIVQSVTQES